MKIPHKPGAVIVLSTTIATVFLLMLYKRKDTTEFKLKSKMETDNQISVIQRIDKDNHIGTRVFRYTNKQFSRFEPRDISGEGYVQLQTPRGLTPIYIHDVNIDAAISRKLYNTHAWEPDLVTLLANEMERDPRFSFVDLGSNLGVYSLSMAKMNRNVVAVDPLEANIVKLYQSAKMGRFNSSFSIIHSAVSNSHANVTLGIDTLNIGGTYVMENKDENKLKITAVGGTYNGSVSTIVLDGLLSIPDVTLTRVIMKIDVEGYEMQVLEGGKRFFEDVNVSTLLMEWLFYKTGHKALKIIQFLNSRKFVPYNAYLPTVRLNDKNFSKWPDDVLWRKTQ